MTDEISAESTRLQTAVLDAAVRLKREFPFSTVVVLASIERDDHSLPAFAWRGTCLATIGLMHVGEKLVRATMMDDYR